MLKYKPDLEETMRRMDAFWMREPMERPLVQFILNKPIDKQIPLPVSNHITSADRWMDAQFQAELTDATLSNQIFMAETLPIAFPNIGPDVLPSFYGCPLHFGDYGTSWSDPVLLDWAQADDLHLNWDSPYHKKLLEITDAMLETRKGKYLVGMPDWHPGGDLIAALRDPQNLALDMIYAQEDVKKFLNRVRPDYFQLFDFWYKKLTADGLPLTSWLPLAAYGKYYIPSNDFSGMISTRMYTEIFLPGIIAECKYLDRSIYHLDGPGALRHLDKILSIPELHAIQWVPGAGKEIFSMWVEVYQRIQAAGKGIIVYCKVADLDLVMQTLNPIGLALSISDVDNQETGEAILKALTRSGSGLHKS